MTALVNMPLELFQVPGGVSVTRRVAGTYVAGRYVAGATSTFVANPAVVWSVQQRDSSRGEVERVSEGQRRRDKITVLTRVELLSAQDPDGPPGDLVLYKGMTYLVIGTTAWDLGGFYESHAVSQVTS